MKLTLLAAVGLASCASPTVVRHAAVPAPAVRRTYPLEWPVLRDKIIAEFRGLNTLPAPFGSMRLHDATDGIATWVDPGGFLDFYKRIPADQRANDLLIEEPTGDLYWQSEYVSSSGPVKFRCGFLLHFVSTVPHSTEVQIYEKVPQIWAGERWDFAHHGIGFSKFHDIRFVEPTAKDRNELLDLIAKFY